MVSTLLEILPEATAGATLRSEPAVSTLLEILLWKKIGISGECLCLAGFNPSLRFYVDVKRLRRWPGSPNMFQPFIEILHV